MKQVRLDELCEISVGRTPARNDATLWGTGEPWLAISDMNQGLWIRHTREQITAAGAAKGRVVKPGTVLLSFKLSIGKVAIAGVPLYTNEAIAALPVRDPSQLDERYLLRALESMDLAGDANRAAMGGTLNKAKLKQIAVPLPGIDEQRRIAAILDHADALRAKRRQVLAHLDDLTQSIFHQMFGDPDSWAKQVEFGDVVTLAGGRNLVADDASAHSEFRVLKISAVTTGRFNAEESKPLPAGYAPPPEHMVQRGDLLMSRANTTDLVGAVALVDGEPHGLVLPDKIWRFNWHDPQSEPRFFHALLSSPSLRRRISRLSSGTGGSMKNVSKSKLNRMLVPAIDVGDQRRFVAKVDAASHIYGRQLEASRNLDELFASLQSRAFRGEL